MCREYKRLKEKLDYLTMMLEVEYSQERQEQVSLSKQEMELHSKRCDLCNSEEVAEQYWQSFFQKRADAKIEFFTEVTA